MSTEKAPADLSREVVVCFESASKAIMAEQALLEQGLFVRVMPKPASIDGGCGFCLRFFPEDYPKAAPTLSAYGAGAPFNHGAP